MIKNIRQLTTSKERKLVLDIIEKVFEEIKTEKIIQEIVNVKKKTLCVKKKKFPLNEYKNIYLIGFGKSSARMAYEIEKILPIKEGYVNCIERAKTKRVKITVAGHPYPDKNTIIGTEKIISLLKKATKDDLIICCISGGGSSLLEKPIKEVSLEKLIKINKKLISSGKSIYEINKIRKNISQVKAGKLALMTKATIVSLIISDVVGNNIQTIASGPTAIKRKNIHNLIIADNGKIIETVKKECNRRKLNFNLITKEMKGEARGVSKILFKKSKKGINLALGETTVTIKGTGKGGRNQELALSALNYLENKQVLASVATDGHDFIPVTGAIVDDLQKEKINVKNFLKNNNAYPALKKLKDIIITGDTGINMMDFVLIYKG